MFELCQDTFYLNFQSDIDNLKFSYVTISCNRNRRHLTNKETETVSINVMRNIYYLNLCSAKRVIGKEVLSNYTLRNAFIWVYDQ